MSPLISVEQFIEAAGGPIEIAIRLRCKEITVVRWVTTGIPLDRWEALTKLFDVTIDELYRMSVRAKRRAKESSRIAVLEGF